MPSIGHGISDAVRNHIPVWIDESLVDILYQEYKKSGEALTKDSFRRNIRQSSSWIRKSRKNTSSGYERLYHCKSVQKATLIVHSPETDLSANGYVFNIDNKPIAGGKTKLKSTHVSTIVSKTDKTTVKASDTVFVKFSEADLIKMRTQMEFGDGFSHLEEERTA